MKKTDNYQTSNAEMVTISRAEYEKLQAQSKRVSELESRVDVLMEALRLARHKQFGASSEKSEDTLMEQLSFLFNEAEVFSAAEKEAEENVTVVAAHKRHKKHEYTLDNIPEGMTTKQVEHRLEGGDLVCPQCGDTMAEIGKEVVQTLEIIPAQMVVREDIYYTYACQACNKDDIETPVVRAPREKNIIPGSFATPEAIAYIMTQKFVMGSPLYRQEQEINRKGIHLSRQTMSNWILKATEDYLTPVYEQLHKELITRDVLHADETTLQVLHEPGKKPQSDSYMWLYRTSGDTDKPIVLYEYQPGRGAKHPKEFLAGYKGYLHTDGYAGYHDLGKDITVVGCWAHARRKFDEAVKSLPKGKAKGSSADELAKNLPVEEIVIDLPESRLTCDKCGGTFKLIGKKLIRRELIIIPQSEKILEYYSCTYACDKCEKDTGFAHIITTKTLPPLMKHSLASPSTVADVMTKKYVDGVPLARQEKIWARQGVELSRATLANWVIQCTQSWLKPLYKHMKQQLLTQSVIHADETVVQVLKEDNKPATSESRMWLYASGEYSKQHIRIFEYQPDRSGKRPESFLKDFTGCLVTDGYAGYNQVAKVTHCGCWAHARRKWREAMPDGATVKTSKAAVGFQYCTKLFSLEKKYIYADVKARKDYRQNVVWPLLEEYFAWLKTIHPEKGSKLEDAVRYSLNQKQQLMAFLDYGDVPISNNLAENAIRPFVVGRKNWLFCDSVKGAESSAIVYSLVETAKANGIEPYEYLMLVLSMLPYLGKSPAHEELEKLMPWHPAVRYREHIRK